MTLVRRAAPLLLTLGLAACATARPVLDEAATTSVASGPAPAPVAGYDWFYDGGPDELHLVYGVKDSDDVRLALSCESGRASLTLSADARPGARQIALESGGETESFPAQAEPSPLSNGDYLTAQGPSDAPVFQRFRRLGWMAMWIGQDRTMMAAHAASAAAIDAFFSRCGARTSG